LDELPFVLRTENVSDALPLAVPVAWGEYPTVTFVLLPGKSVNGPASPLEEKAAPLTTGCEIEIFQLVVLVRTKDCVLELPTTTLPKLTVVGLAANCPAANAEQKTSNSRGTPTFRNLHCKRKRFTKRLFAPRIFARWGNGDCRVEIGRQLCSFLILNRRKVFLTDHGRASLARHSGTCGCCNPFWEKY
jgi:hypothetical protein